MAPPLFFACFLALTFSGSNPIKFSVGNSAKDLKGRWTVIRTRPAIDPQTEQDEREYLALWESTWVFGADGKGYVESITQEEFDERGNKTNVRRERIHFAYVTGKHKKLRTIDFRFLSPLQARKDRQAQGIFELHDHKLTICYSAVSRPVDFPVENKLRDVFFLKLKWIGDG